MSKIELGKTYRTRGGKEVRIYAVDGARGMTVQGAIKTSDGWVSKCWDAYGRVCSIADSIDLIEVRPRIKREFWVNVYPDGPEIQLYESRAFADKRACHDRIACIPITIDCQEGEGLE